MGKLIRLALIGAALYAGYALHTQGLEGAFGGALAGFTEEGRRESATETLEQTALYQHSDPRDAGSKRVPITQAVRDRVTSSIAKSTARQEEADRRAGR